MITYVTGDLLKSDAQCLVNTVNCEGYMGKGIAYQFKLVYPQNNDDYIKACKSGKLHIGAIHYFCEKGKLIINFPTKDKWRLKSKIEYIEIGLDLLIEIIKQKQIKSIAIPPLGSGNGGLEWSQVKSLIEKKMSVLSDDIRIFIYEPSKNYVSRATIEPRISLSALVLMQIKFNLRKFDAFRLQKTAFLMDIFFAGNSKGFFNFVKWKYGPYDHSIDIVSKKIKEFQSYYNVVSTEEAYEIAYRKITSSSVDYKLNSMIPHIKAAAEYVNNIKSDSELECVATILYIIKEKGSISEEAIIEEFRLWSKEKAERFNEDDIIRGIKHLYFTGIVEKSLLGYTIAIKISCINS